MSDYENRIIRPGDFDLFSGAVGKSEGPLGEIFFAPGGGFRFCFVGGLFCRLRCCPPARESGWGGAAEKGVAAGLFAADRLACAAEPAARLRRARLVPFAAGLHFCGHGRRARNAPFDGDF